MRKRRPWSATAPQGAIDELMEQPMLASVLESGLAAFDLSCDGIGDAHLASAELDRSRAVSHGPPKVAVQRRAR